MTKPVTVPYPPVIVLSIEGKVLWSALLPLIKDRLENGVSVCITASTGVPNHGGYFFHIRNDPGGIAFSTFDRESVCMLKDGGECEIFINHVMGIEYSERMWKLSQQINLKTDKFA